MNSSFIRTYRVQIKQEFKSSKIIYSKRSRVQEFKNRVQNHKLVERLFSKPMLNKQAKFDNKEACECNQKNISMPIRMWMLFKQTSFSSMQYYGWLRIFRQILTWLNVSTWNNIPPTTKYRNTEIQKYRNTEIHFADLPDEGPVISGSQPRYHTGDILTANCSSSRSLPAASLKWANSTSTKNLLNLFYIR